MSLWETRVLASVESAHKHDQLALTNGLPKLLQNLVSTLEADGTVEGIAQQLRDNKTVNTEHGRERATLTEYELEEVFFEYSILRQTIIDFVRSEAALTERASDVINLVLDHAIKDSTSEFVRVRTLEVRNLARRLQQSNADLQRFSAIVAHDLKSPLATIFSFVGVLDEDLGDKKTVAVEQDLQAIASNSQRLILLVDKLLSYATLERDDSEYAEVHLSDVLADAISNLKSLIDETHAQILSNNLPKVRADRSFLTQLLQNLIANSIKFRTRGQNPVIRFSLLTEDEEQWTFSLRDNGIGFDQNVSDQIFEPFKKMHRKQEYMGHGLGLATCKRVVELHGGKIWATGEAGKGATFHFTLSKDPDAIVLRD